MKLAAKDIHKIAVFRALKLGDMLCTVPGLRALRAAYPKAEIVLLGLPWAKIFVERFNKYLDRFIHFPGYEGLPEQPYNKKDIEDFLQAMRLENFDLVLQMQGNGTIVNPLMFLFNSKNIAGFYNDESYVASDLFMRYPGTEYEAKRHLLLMNHIDIQSNDLDLEFPITEKDVQELDALYLPLLKNKYVCIHPGSADALRQWPTACFAALANYCIEHKFTVVVTGTKEEQDITKELIKCIHHPVIDLTGKTSLGAIAALIKNAYMLIANCTGVAHIAAAVKTPSLIISMDGEPERWAPLNKERHHVIDWTKNQDFEMVFNTMVAMIKSSKPFV
ncbi:MAG: glycosyltransferase family 9 protein [Parafilimonas sp.]